MRTAANIGLQLLIKLNMKKSLFSGVCFPQVRHECLTIPTICSGLFLPVLVWWRPVGIPGEPAQTHTPSMGMA